MSTEGGFVHSVKVPHVYKVSSKIVKVILEEGGSIKELLYTHVRANLKGAYALITKTIEHNTDLDRVLERSKILVENQKLDPWLAKVLVAELLLGKGHLASECKPVQTVLSYRTALEQASNESAVELGDKSPDLTKPRYVRVNVLRKTTDEVIKALRLEGWELIADCDSYEKFLSQIKNLNESQFLRDFHLKNVLVFPARTEFFRHELYRDGTIILQDKASCLPPYLLNPEPRKTVLDMCAAPGMKTTMLSALMRGKGKVYAVEMNNRRFQTLNKMISTAGCENVVAIEADSLQILAASHPWCNDVEYILVDPTCSGTGMTERARLFKYDQTRDIQLRKLTAFQRRLLMHALTKFPSVRRVVYSTCSILEEENEGVVSSVLNCFPSPQPWTVVDPLPEWQSRGSLSYEFGSKCLTASPTTDLTTGFFIAVFDRVDGIEIVDPYGEGKTLPARSWNGNEYQTKGKSRRKKRKYDADEFEDVANYEGKMSHANAEGYTDIEKCPENKGHTSDLKINERKWKLHDIPAQGINLSESVDPQKEVERNELVVGKLEENSESAKVSNHFKKQKKEAKVMELPIENSEDVTSTKVSKFDKKKKKKEAKQQVIKSSGDLSPNTVDSDNGKKQKDEIKPQPLELRVALLENAPADYVIEFDKKQKKRKKKTKETVSSERQVVDGENSTSIKHVRRKEKNKPMIEDLPLTVLDDELCKKKKKRTNLETKEQTIENLKVVSSYTEECMHDKKRKQMRNLADATTTAKSVEHGKKIKMKESEIKELLVENSEAASARNVGCKVGTMKLNQDDVNELTVEHPGKYKEGHSKKKKKTKYRELPVENFDSIPDNEQSKKKERDNEVGQDNNENFKRKKKKKRE